MKKKIGKIIYYILSFVSLLMAASLFMQGVRSEPGTDMQRWSMEFAAIFIVCAFIFLFKAMGNSIADVTKKFVTSIFTFFAKVAGKLSSFFGGGRERSNASYYIKGFTDVSEAVERQKKKKPAKLKFGRWSELSNAERVRFVYAKRIQKKIKGGYELDHSLTPHEVAKDLREHNLEQENADELYDLYYMARYQKSIKIEDSKPEKLKKKFL